MSMTCVWPESRRGLQNTDSLRTNETATLRTVTLRRLKKVKSLTKGRIMIPFMVTSKWQTPTAWCQPEYGPLGRLMTQARRASEPVWTGPASAQTDSLTSELIFERC